MSMFSDKVIQFYHQLKFTGKLPAGIELLNPYQSKVAMMLCEQFFHQYYDDSRTRQLILGINPGRLGGGLTGISFTDPIQLQQACGILNSLPQKAELSSTFMYNMIASCGGVQLFYQHFFVSSVCPLGFVMDGKNLNYYDVSALQKAAEPFIIKSLRNQLRLGIDPTICFCLGEGKNLTYLNQLNEKHQFFGEIKALPHPRFVMQYKRKQLDGYINQYKQVLFGDSTKKPSEIQTL